MAQALLGYYGEKSGDVASELASLFETARDFARADLPHRLESGSAAEIVVRLPALAETGRYRLKLDLVNEGVDWFERCGSPTTSHTLWVR